MNITKTITLTIAGILMIAMLLSIIQLLLRKLKTDAETDFKWKSSYGIWFTGLFAAATIIISRTIVFLSEAIDNIIKIGSPHQFLEITQISSLYIGLSIAWYLLWYYIAKVFAVIVMGRKNELEEMGLNNVHYFLIRATIFIGIIFSFSFILDLLFRFFMPNIPVPFYH